MQASDAGGLSGKCRLKTNLQKNTTMTRKTLEQVIQSQKYLPRTYYKKYDND